jgi:hypothetical protein
MSEEEQILSAPEPEQVGSMNMVYAGDRKLSLVRGLASAAKPGGLQAELEEALRADLVEQLGEPRASAPLRKRGLSFFARTKSTEEKVEYLTKHLELDPDELQKEGAARYIMASAK